MRAAPAFRVDVDAPSEARAQGSAIAAENISLTFGGLNVLRNVSFSAPRDITAIIGPNGAGKTSLFNVISGFYRPDHGAIRLDDRDITRLPVHAARGKRPGADVPEHRAVPRPDGARQHQARWPSPDARQPAVGAAVRALGAPAKRSTLRDEVEARVIDFLEIDHIRHRSVESLSYGLQKRVELARALAMRPRVLMLDEPVAGMNREETEDMARFILDVQEEWGVTMLLVEHDMGMVMDISNHVVVLNFGEVIAAGTPAEVRRNPEVIRPISATEGSCMSDVHRVLRCSACSPAGVYALIALSFVLIYKGTHVINFAVGEIMMLGAYLYYAGNVTAGPAAGACHRRHRLRRSACSSLACRARGASAACRASRPSRC